MSTNGNTPMINFKFGKLASLNSVDLNPGTIYVTTDTHSMYVDLPGTDGNHRFRLSDFERYTSLQELVKNQHNWYVGSLALIETTDKDAEGNPISSVPILAYYTGKEWLNINDTSALQQAISELTGNFEEASESFAAAIEAINEKLDGVDDVIGIKPETTEKTLWESIVDIQGEIGERPDPTTTIWEAIAGLTGGEEGSIASLNQRISEIVEQFEEASDSLSTAIEANTKLIEDNVTELNEQIAEKEEALSNRIDSNKSEIDELNEIVGIEDGSVNERIETAVSTAKNELTAAANSIHDNINSRIDKLYSGSTKYATSKDGSVFDLVTEFLVSANAPEAYNSLIEISEWIASHPGEAAEMSAAINDLKAKTKLGTYFIEQDIIDPETNDKIGTEKIEQEYATVKDYVTAVSNAALEQLALLESMIENTNNKFYWQSFDPVSE